MNPARFVLVGATGWRAQFFLRTAQQFPHLFTCTGLLVRSPDRAREIHDRWHLPVYQTLDALLDHGQPLFAITSIARTATLQVLTAIAAAGIPTLCETPPAGTVEELCQLHALAQRGARIQIAEQYIFQPAHAARLAIIRAGLLGTPTYAHLSFSHAYHNVSLIRHYLDVGMSPCTIRAQRFTQKITQGPHRPGPPTEDKIVDCPHVLATLDFGDKVALYDWADNQHRSYIRSTHTLIRGPRGELNDNTLKYLPATEDGFQNPITLPLLRQDAGHHENLEGLHLKSITAGQTTYYRNPFPLSFETPRLLDDELAVATCMLKMTGYAKGGPDFYSLAEASQDTYLGMLIDESAASGNPIATTSLPWHHLHQ